MENPLNWLGLPPQAPAASFFVPPVPNRAYSLTAADALSLGRQSADIFEEAAKFQNLQMEQALAPQRFGLEQQKLARDSQILQAAMQAQPAAVAAFSQLDPSAEDYLTKRRDAVAANPYALADPTVQELLRANDRAYDDYLNTQRLAAYGTRDSGLSPSQRSSFIRMRVSLEDQIRAAEMMGEADRADELRRSLREVESMLTEPPPGAAASAATPAPAPVPAPSPVGSKELPMGSKDEANASAQEVGTALARAAQESGESPTEFLRALRALPEAERIEFFRTLGFGASAEEAFKRLQKTPALLESMGASLREATQESATPPAPFERGTWKITPLPQ